MDHFPFLSFAGDHRKIGREHGRLAAEKIRHLADKLSDHQGCPSSICRHEVENTSVDGAVINEECPREGMHIQ